MTRAVIYCRISQDRGGERVGVDRQLRDCRERVKGEGYALAAEPFVDNNISAYSGKPRPRYREMVKLIESDGIGVIVVWHIDRLYRSPRELEDLIDLVADKGMIVDAVTASPVDLSNTDGQAMARIGVAIARKSSDDTRRRVKSSKADAKVAGLRLGGGRRPWGYDWRHADDGSPVEGGGLQVIPEEAAAVREALERILQGEPLHRIAQDFRVRGVPAPRKPAYIRRALVGRNGEPSHLVGGSNWPGIITKDEWRAATARLTGGSKYTPKDRRTGRRYALTGLVVCSECGTKMLGSGGYYRCAAIRGGCGRVGIKARDLEDALDMRVQQRREAGLARDAEGAASVAVDTEAQREALADIAAAEAEQADLDAAVRRGEVTAVTAGKMIDALEARRNEAAGRFAAVSPTSTGYGFAALLEPDDWHDRWVAGQLSETELADLHEMFASYLEAVQVSPGRRGDVRGRVKVRWHP